VLVFYKKYRLQGIKGFDDDFFAHQEIDLCWRALNKGHKIKYNHKSGLSFGRRDLAAGNPKKTLNFRNSLMLTKKFTKGKVIFIA
jgi:GT2 family glycosyltransferase